MLGGKINFGSLLKNAGKLQEMMEQTQHELANTEIHGEAGAGLVKVMVTGKNQVKKVDLDPELLKEPKEVIEELIAAAFNDALSKVEKITKDKMMNASKLFGGSSSGSESDSE